MKKRHVIVMVFIISIIFTACDSMWSVQSVPDVALRFDLSKYLPENDSALEPLFSRSIPLGSPEMAVSYTIDVSLHYGSTDAIIETKRFSHSDFDDVANILVEFEEIPTTAPVYASITILDNTAAGEDPLFFSAISDIKRLTSGDNVLEARPNVVFYDEDRLRYSTKEDGSATVNEVEVLERAIEMLGGEERVKRGATIYAKKSILIEQNAPWDYAGLTVKKGGDDITLLEGTGSLYTVTLDGNKEYYSGRNLVRIDGSGSGSYTISGNVVLKNNDARDSDGGALYVNNVSTLTFRGVIQDNETTANGGGMYLNNVENLRFLGSIVNCSAGLEGGGMYLNNTTTIPSFSGSILNNRADTAGGLYANNNISITFNAGSAVYGNTNTAIEGGENGNNLYFNEAATLTSTSQLNMGGNVDFNANGYSNNYIFVQGAPTIN